MVFHDGAPMIAIIHLESLTLTNGIELVLFSQFLGSFRNSAVLEGYIIACMVWSVSILSMNQAESPADPRLECE